MYLFVTLTLPAERWWRSIEPEREPRGTGAWRKLATQALPCRALRALDALADAIPGADPEGVAELRGVLAALRTGPRDRATLSCKGWRPPDARRKRRATELEALQDRRDRAASPRYGLGGLRRRSDG